MSVNYFDQWNSRERRVFAFFYHTKECKEKETKDRPNTWIVLQFYKLQWLAAHGLETRVIVFLKKMFSTTPTAENSIFIFSGFRQKTS